MSSIPTNLLEGWDVLVVDDEAMSLDVATRILKHYNANVITAKNGQEALDILETQRPKFIISDISMPVMDGWEFIERIKNSTRLLDIPVIALTAHAMVGDREKAIAAGFHNYIAKPLNPSTFMNDLIILLTDVPEFDLDYGD